MLGAHHVSSDYRGCQHNLPGGSFCPDSHPPRHSVIVINGRFGHDTTVFINTFNKFELTSVIKAHTAHCAQALDFTPLPAVSRSPSDTNLLTRHTSLTPDRGHALLLPVISCPAFLPAQFHTPFNFKYLRRDLLLRIHYLCLHQYPQSLLCKPMVVTAPLTLSGLYAFAYLSTSKLLCLFHAFVITVQPSQCLEHKRYLIYVECMEEHVF